jgi:uncharacterized protein (DUF433 family)
MKASSNQEPSFMPVPFNGEPTIIRTERGLIISGTRITLYDVMDYFVAGYPAKLIREKLCLTDAQVNAGLSYIEAHKVEVEAEYQQVLKIAEENQQLGRTQSRTFCPHCCNNSETGARGYPCETSSLER